MNQIHKPDLASPVSPVDHALGPAHAPVTVVEYGDFECPTCKQAAQDIKLLFARFVNQVRVIYRHFPIEAAHPHAMIAAQAAEAAAAQGKFWHMHDLLFDNQHHLEPDHLRRYAEELQLDMARYTTEMDDEIYLQRVREHVDSGRRSHVRSALPMSQSPAIPQNGAVPEPAIAGDLQRSCQQCDAVLPQYIRRINQCRLMSAMSASKFSADERQKMVAEAAYFRAQGRGFGGGDAVADWVEAESDVNARLREMEHNALLEQLQERLAAAAENLRTLHRKVSGMKVEARAEWQKDLEKLTESRDALQHKLDELGERGQQASRKLREQAEEIAAEMSGKISELGDRLSARRRGPRKT